MHEVDLSGEAEVRAPDAVSAMLRARSIAVIGASDKPGSFGHNVVTQLVETGFSGRLYAVNPRYESVAGVRCFATLAKVPETVDCAVLAVSDERLEAALVTAAEAGARSAAIFGSAFEEETAGRPPLSDRLSAIARQAGMAVCGNNCMGFLNLADQVIVGGWPYKPLPERGPIGFITHSGSTYSAFALNQRQLGMSYLISAGQEIATTTADYMHFLLSRPDVRVIGCILETARDPENFIAALDRADRQGVPVVTLKLGRSAAGGKMARAHSGALAGSDAAYRAVFERHNVLAVRTVNELADTLELLACPRSPTAEGVAVAADSGGERTLIVDLAADIGLTLASLTAETTQRLADTLDPGLAPINPVDVWGTGHDHERIMRSCLDALAADPNVGQVVLASNMLSGRPLLHAWSRVAEAVHGATTKPVVVMGHLTPAFDRDEAARLRALGVPVLPETSSGLRALAGSARWHQRRNRVGLATPRDASHAAAASTWSERLSATSQASLDTADSLAMAAAFGIPVAPNRLACSLEEGVAAGEELGYPVVLKTLAPGIDHKFDHGGVVIGLSDREVSRRRTSRCPKGSAAASSSSGKPTQAPRFSSG